MKQCQKIILIPLLLGAFSACTLIHQPPMQLPSQNSVTPGETVTVNSQQNVYAFARAHNVSMRELIVLNNLQSPFLLHQGQSITLPASHPANLIAAGAPEPSAAVVSSVEETTLPPVTMPAGNAQATSPSSNAVVPAPVTSEAVAPISGGKTQVDTLNQPSPPPKTVITTASPAPTAVASTTPVPAKAASNESGKSEDTPEFVWPVQGPVLSSFGSKGQGLNNDGVNIGAPKGSPVVAAASGTVVYAGNEMKGFGNLILIRHPGSWVTAYAHLDRILVNKDTVVASGDMIGTVGKSGDVPSPQLHFETRHNSKPVDPASVVKAE